MRTSLLVNIELIQHKSSAETERRIQEAKAKNPEISNRKLCRMFHVHHSVVSRVLKNNLETRFAEKSEISEQIGDTWVLTLPKTRISTLEELLEYCKVDLGIWQVERFLANKWEGFSKDNDGNVNVTPLFQVKAHLKKKQNIIDARAEIEALKAEAKKDAKIPKPILRSTKHSGNLLEISLNDAHFGKLAWGIEVGGIDYDSRIAQETFIKAVDNLLDRSKGFNVDHILFVVGNDLLHSDDLQGRTTKGTIVDCDTRYQKTFEIVRQTVTQCIERFRLIAPVTVKMVSGNHDELSIWHLGDSLSCYFANYEDVEVDNTPIYRKYFEWGLCSLMMTHGDKAKRSDLPLLFATEKPELFGRTKWREIHTGHLHSTKTEEFHGVRVRILPSLSPPDYWHFTNGFVGQQRVGEAYLYNKEEGLIAQFFYNADGEKED